MRERMRHRNILPKATLIGVQNMKILSFTLAILLASSSALMAQTTNFGTPRFGTPSFGTPRPFVGGPSVVAHPANSSDLIGRSNPQDLTRPGANNSQDLLR